MSAQSNSYSRPVEPPPPLEGFASRILPPVEPIPLPKDRPPLPFPQRLSPFEDYVLTTHLTPCARPRAHRSATRSSVRPPHPDLASIKTHKQRGKNGQNGDVKALMSKMVQQRGEDLAEPSWKAEGYEPQLWAVVNRFVRKRPAQRATLFFAHANGFPKETWEPVIGMLLEQYDKVDEILVWEVCNHGDAALVNAGNLGDTFDWADSARDVLLFLTHYRPLPSCRSATVHLQPHAREIPARPVIAVGHSHGGEIVTRAALHNPSLFSCLILIEPVILMETWVMRQRRCSEKKRDELLIRSTLSRRTVWPSLASARMFFQNSPFFQLWHPAVLDSYIDHALYPLPVTGEVALKQSPYDEANFYTDPRAPTETWCMLPTLDDRVELRWILGSKPGGFLGGEELVRQMVWRRPRNSTNVVVEDVGHFIPQEMPERIALEIAQVLRRRHGSCWKDKVGNVRLRFAADTLLARL